MGCYIDPVRARSCLRVERLSRRVLESREVKSLSWETTRGGWLEEGFGENCGVPWVMVLREEGRAGLLFLGSRQPGNKLRAAQTGVLNVIYFCGHCPFFSNCLLVGSIHHGKRHDRMTYWLSRFV